MKTNKFFTKNKILYILFLIIIVVLIYTYKSYENFTASPIPVPICRTSVIPCREKVFDIIICIGQSNVIGKSVRSTQESTYYTNDRDYTDDLNYVIHPRVYKVLCDYNNLSSVNICESQDAPGRFTMLTSLGREYARRQPTKNVLLINVARSSTGILNSRNFNSNYLWQVDSTSTNSKIPVYPLAAQFINNVKSKICPTSKVVAICYQGSEEDSYAPCSAYNTTYINNYNNLMSRLLNKFKSDFGDRNTKIMVGGLLLNSGKPCTPTFVNSVLREVVSRNIRNGYIFVSTDASIDPITSNIKYFQRRLTSGDGSVHFDKISYIELGKRFAYNYFNGST